MAKVDRNGVSVYYEDNGSGPAVLMTHGYSANSQMWAGQVKAMSDQFRIITWDMRGHGLTDSPEDQAEYSEAATVEDMAAILKACGVDQAVIGGLSLGGYMSAAFHLAHPEMTRALMLIDTGPGYKNPQSRAGWNETSNARADRFDQLGLDALGGSAEVRVSTHRSGAGLAKAARGMLAQFDSRVIESLPEIKVPTMVLLGENDTPFIGGSEYMAKKIPGATYVLIPDAGHASNLDQPAAFNAAVTEFLNGLS
jgi:pimeloyl-ACP methyl ester carboxylesterase